MLRTRHKDLLRARPPAPAQGGPAESAGEGRAGLTVTILHVEDDRSVANVVRDTLEEEGWEVEACGDGTAAAGLIEGDTRYDFLLFDHELPGVTGLELIGLARGLPHRRRTPVVMLSASDVEEEARRAGADAFLRKPQDIHLLAEVVERLLARKSE
jgi:CheY-like chemotaxis protein